MKKDPAVLFYVNDWLTSTASMDADTRGWYINLILHNYDKKTLPNDIEKLAVLAGVKFSEFERFKQVFEQVFKHKFEQIDEENLSNLKISTLIQNREFFQSKRSDAGKVSYIMRYMAKNYNKQYKIKALKDYVKDNFDYSIDLKNEQMLKQVFEHLFELYRNENINSNILLKDFLKNENSEIEIPIVEKKLLNGFYNVLVKKNDFLPKSLKFDTNYKALKELISICGIEGVSAIILYTHYHNTKVVKNNHIENMKSIGYLMEKESTSGAYRYSVLLDVIEKYCKNNSEFDTQLKNKIKEYKNG